MALVRLRDNVDNAGLLSDFQNHLNQLFDNFLGQQPAALERTWAPPADVWETPDDYVVSVEMPGFTDKDIRLSVTADQLLIEAERLWDGDREKATFHRRERWYGKLQRAFSLAMPVDSAKAAATYRDGMLTIRLPKTENIKPKEVPIQAG